MNPLERIQSYYSDLTKTDLDIANIILEDPREVARASINHVASLAHVSKSAVVRFSNRIGYNGFTDLKYDLARYLTSRNASPDDSNEADPIRAITENYCRYIMQINDSVNVEDLEHIAKLMLSSKKIKIFGQNRTYNSALQLRKRLAKIGVDAESVSDTALMDELTTALDTDDCAIIFTIADNTGHFKKTVKSLAESKCKIICLTMSPALPFRRHCTEYIVLPRISKSSTISFLDDQAIYFVFIELLLDAVASAMVKNG